MLQRIVNLVSRIPVPPSEVLYLLAGFSYGVIVAVAVIYG